MRLCVSSCSSVYLSWGCWSLLVLTEIVKQRWWEYRFSSCVNSQIETTPPLPVLLDFSVGHFLGHRLQTSFKMYSFTVIGAFRLDNNLCLNIYTLFPFFELQEKHNGWKTRQVWNFYHSVSVIHNIPCDGKNTLVTVQSSRTLLSAMRVSSGYPLSEHNKSKMLSSAILKSLPIVFLQIN